MSNKSLGRSITLCAIAGILLSTYALYVEMSAESTPEYKALCDLNDYVSCSKVLTSDYSKGFGLVEKGSRLEIPNCIYGTIFYCLMIYMTTYDGLLMVRLQLLTAVMACVSCVYLVYLLIFVLKDFCIVCVSTYFLNGILAALICKKLQQTLQKCR